MAIPPYDLPGAQVEPGASYWLKCDILDAVTIDKILARLGPIDPFTKFSEQEEFAEVQRYYDIRKNPVPDLSRMLTNPIFFERVPAGAVLSTNPRNGRPLPISNETPGLWHRHVLNVILDPRVERGAGRVLSPPRQALIWAALDIAIMRALSAAWHVKWLGGKDIEYRRRPYEYFAQLQPRPDFQVLYDLAVQPPPGRFGRITRKVARTGSPQPSPGTPRHPAYPSGHSTYSAAASAVLGCLFTGYEDPRPALRDLDWKAEFGALAKNIGFARFYGGVHWESDHTLGERLGGVVGQMVVEQLNRSGIPRLPTMLDRPPPERVVKREAERFAGKCGQGRENFCKGTIPDPVSPAESQNVA
jgi:membrane-associated phospholipid phosphatase